MREIIARIVCAVTVCLVLALAWFFAAAHNPRPVFAPQDQSDRIATEPDREGEIEHGWIVYTEQGCSSCHAVAGRGNPRYPLDGVAARHTAGELRQYVTATDGVEARLPAAIVRRKARYRQLDEEEMTALIRYLSSLSDRR